MITLHHLDQSRSFRILWALEELGLDYEIKFYHRQPNLSAPNELKLIHPLGKAPILTDAEQTIAESAVILEYLQQHYDTQRQFKPQQASAQQAYQYWMHYAEGSLMPLLVMQLVMTNVPQHVPWLVRPMAQKITAGVKAGFIQPRLKDHIAYLEDYLGKHDYFAGDFSLPIFKWVSRSKHCKAVPGIIIHRLRLIWHAWNSVLHFSVHANVSSS